jgi:hypothetical protein
MRMVFIQADHFFSMTLKRMVHIRSDLDVCMAEHRWLDFRTIRANASILGFKLYVDRAFAEYEAKRTKSQYATNTPHRNYPIGGQVPGFNNDLVYYIVGGLALAGIGAVIIVSAVPLTAVAAGATAVAGASIIWVGVTGPANSTNPADLRVIRSSAVDQATLNIHVNDISCSDPEILGRFPSFDECTQQLSILNRASKD